MTNEIISGIFRPNLSLSGPRSNCPTAKPIIAVVSVSCVIEALVSKKLASCGSEGK